METRKITWQINARLNAREMTRNELAHELGINKRNLYLATVGRQNFTLEMLTKLAAYFKCSVDDLLAETPECYR